jgi:ketosteroid isomerase-like protein
LASKDAVAASDGSLAAFDRGDFDSFAAYFTKDAVFKDPAGGEMAEGCQAIADMNEGYYTLGARYYRESAVIQRGNLAAYVILVPAVSRSLERDRSDPVR